MLEAGRMYDPQGETPMFQTATDAPLRATPTPDKPFGYYDATVGGGWEIPGEPYTTAAGSQFRWWRSRMLGGRTNHWGRISLRYARHDLEGKSRDGIGVDWPVPYDELSHYYDKVENLIGIFGSNDGLEDAPDSPPQILHPPPAQRAHERLMVRAGKKLGRPVVATRMAILTRPHRGRPPCFYASPCLRGCSIGANFQSTTVLIPPAMATGKLSIVTDAMVYELVVDKAGRVTGANYIDKTTGQHRFIRAINTVLAASAFESVRILLNSRSNRFPQGIGNTTGRLGKAITDTVGGKVIGQVPALESLPPHDDFGVSLDHVYTPWWGLAEQRTGRLGFPRGYHFELGGGRMEPRPFTLDQIAGMTAAPLGSQLKEEMRRYYGSFVSFTQRGEMVPNEQSFVSIDADVTDRWEIPVLKFNFGFSDYERKQHQHAQASAAEFIDALGGRVIKPRQSQTISVGGEIIHEIGGAVMGTSRNDSVVDSFGKVWDVPNLQVVDGAVFPSHPHKNPTLTILALAWRASQHLIERSTRRD
jgi:choline dehydrogenase-like flavoprotein